MTFFQDVAKLQKERKTLLCVGLDPDLKRFPEGMPQEPKSIFPFNKAIIDATADLACTFKPNIAFYEEHGDEGREALRKTIAYVHDKGIPLILDAKRADIGNTGEAYARAIFNIWEADATTVNPYFGRQGVEPFFAYKDKGIFVLALTSHMLDVGELYIHVAREAVRWNANGNIGLVVAANQKEKMANVRSVAPGIPFLIPGVGAQKGDVDEAIRTGTAGGAIAIVNAARSILYASSGKDFAEAAKAEAIKLRDQLAVILT